MEIIDAQAKDDKLPGPPRRLASMDQLRGYAIFGMIFVNYLGAFNVMPEQFKHHHDRFTYADTIAPLFMFVVGMGFRLSLLRRISVVGIGQARWAAFKRYVAIIGLGIVFYGVSQYRAGWWDAITDIGFAGLLSIPFIERSMRVRVAAAFVYLLIFQICFTFAGYGEWTMANSIDGGPLGPLSWAVNLLFGTIAYDLLATRNTQTISKWSLIWGVALCVLGWLFYFEWPGVKQVWVFSQKGMTAPYALYSTGLCFLTFLAFYAICDVWHFRFPCLTVLGENALVIYLAQNILQTTNSDLFRGDMPMAPAILIYVVGYLCCYAVAWKLHKDRIIVKI